MEVKIPAGVETGSRLRVSGEGEAELRVAPPGDLYVVIHVAEHEQFERQGSNLYEAVPITLRAGRVRGRNHGQDARRRREAEGPDGHSNRHVFRLRGKGMPVLGGRGRGDLFVSVTVITPTTLTREQRRLLEQLAEVENKDLEIKGWSIRSETFLGEEINADWKIL
jgi:molecular chaperone DnaJ